MAMTAKLWTINALAAELGHTARTVSKALKGFPPDGKSGRWDAWHMTTTVAALGDRKTETFDLTAERARFAAAQADDREMKNALARRDQITVGEFHQMMVASFGRVRAKMLALPSKMVPLVMSAATPAEAQRMLRDVVHGALDELAATTVTGVSEDAGIEQGGA